MVFIGITLVFLKQFGFALLETFPLLLSLGVLIALLGYTVGRKEGWSSSESLYWSFITATTVGYGDIRPAQNISRIIAIVIAFLGLTLSGIIVALAVHAGTVALRTVGSAS